MLCFLPLQNKKGDLPTILGHGNFVSPRMYKDNVVEATSVVTKHIITIAEVIFVDGLASLNLPTVAT